MILQTNLQWAYTPGRFTKPVKYLVLHHAAGNGSVEAIHAYHRDVNGWAGIAYHLYVRKDGKVYAGRPMDRQGGHCLNYNGVSIGICFEGNFETETMSEAQKAGGVEAVAYAMAYYPGMTIVGHRELGPTECPGKKFPLEYFKLYDEADKTKEEEELDVSKLTGEQCYKILCKAQEHAADLPAPGWAEKELKKAIENGITDGTRPAALVTRCEAALMAGRARGGSL